MNAIAPAPETNDASKFKYEELAQILRKRILTLASGSRLPSVRSLMRRYKISLQTVSAALKILEEENLIVSRRGSGIYVSDHRTQKLIILHRSHYPSHYEDIKENGLRRAIAAAGWHLIVRRHELVGEDEDAMMTPEPKACAHIVAQDLANIKFALLNQLVPQDVPIVLMDREAGGFSFDYVTGSEKQVFILLIKHLRSLGHQRFGLLVNEPNYFEIQQRKLLFLEILEMLDLPQGIIVDCDTEPGQSSALNARDGLSRYIASVGGRLPFTALLVTSEAGGSGALRAMHEHGIAVPGQCSVATYGTMPENALFVPSLTGAGTDLSTWGEWIVRLLKQRFNGDQIPSLGIKVPVELKVRESTGPAPATIEEAE